MLDGKKKAAAESRSCVSQDFGKDEGCSRFAKCSQTERSLVRRATDLQTNPVIHYPPLGQNLYGWYANKTNNLPINFEHSPALYVMCTS
jgi:hypothetical protein